MSDHVLRLADGRTLSWAEYGDPSGRPLVALHGLPGSRRQWVVGDAAARAAGVRLLAPERPGYGLSSPKSGFSFASYADDLRQLADALDLTSFSLAGASGGGGFALEAAALFGERVPHLLLVCALYPGVPEEALAAQSRPVRFAFVIGRRLPWLVAPLLARGSRSRPEAGPALERAMRAMPEPDRRAARLMATDPQAAADGVEAFRQGGRAATHEMGLYARPLTTDLSRITARVTLLHGRQDVNVPVAVARWMASLLPSAELIELDDAAHLFLAEQPSAVLGRVGH